jgi:hypothetical protein
LPWPNKFKANIHNKQLLTQWLAQNADDLSVIQGTNQTAINRVLQWYFKLILDKQLNYRCVLKMIHISFSKIKLVSVEWAGEQKIDN